MVNEGENDNSSGSASSRRGAFNKDEKNIIARNIHNRMVARGWRQADLARAAAVSRNSVSVYIKGTAVPDEKNLLKLARALRCEPSDLVPTYDPLARFATTPPAQTTPMGGYEMRAGPEGDELAILIINHAIVPRKLAFEIIGMLEAYREASDGKRSSK